MKSIEMQLLDNALDALDGLYDQKLRVVDLWALLLATSEAMRDTLHYGKLVAPVEELLVIAKSGESEETMGRRALIASDPLRKYLASL